MKARRIVHAMSAIGFAIPCAASADDGAPLVETRMEKIEITGSSIKRIEGESALPVQVLRHEDIARTGATTVAELLSSIPSASGSGNANVASANSSGTGNVMAGASLRGLGYQRTLVLLNGRRVANNALTGDGVDLEMIPLSAIDRVEVLQDGASAIYGADAVGGVINFILAKNYEGMEATAYGSGTQHGGASEQRVTLTYGHGDLGTDRYNAFVTADLRKDSPLHAADRSFSSTAVLPAEYGSGRYQNLSNYPFPGNAFYTDGSGTTTQANIGDPNCTGKNLFVNPNGGCLFDYAPFGTILPKQEKLSLIGNFTYRLGADQELFIETAYSRNRYFLSTGAPTYADGSGAYPEGSFPGSVPFQVFADSPYYPTAFATSLGVNGQPINFVARLIELGSTDSININSQARLVAGLKGLVDGWDYSAAFNYNRAGSTEDYTSGQVDTAAFYNLTLSGLYNPFGPQSSAGLAALQATQWRGRARTASDTLLSVGGHASRDLVQLPAGPLQVALGMEVRREKLDQAYGDHYANGWLLDYGGATPPATPAPRTISALSAEIDVPMTHTLEGNLSLRTDHYSDFGTTTNPKASLRWQPSRAWILRAAYGTGFRAPNLVDVGTPLNILGASNSFSDPIRCPGGTPVPGANLAYDCNNYFFAHQYGPNHLQPEKSRQSSLGLVFEPDKRFSVGVNVFRIDLNDVIQPQGLPQSLAFDPATASQYAFMLVRGPVDPLAPNLPGPILYINSPPINAGKWKVHGSDIDASYRLAIADAGALTAKMNGTWFQKFDIQQFDGTFVENVGQKNPAGNGVVNRWQHYLSFGWNRASWDIALAQTYRSGYQDENNLLPDGSFPRVRSYTIYDLTVEYEGLRHFRVSGGVRNLLDRSPPFTNNYEATGFDPSYADPRGRMFWLSASYLLK
jgi:iron complex outermembrane receptor protein